MQGCSDPCGNIAYTALGIGLVLWSPDTGWNNRSAIVLCHLLIDSVDALIFPALIVRFGDASFWMQLHEDLRQAGFFIKTTEESCENFAIIDEEIVWYGNVHLLGKEKIEDSIMRIRDKEIAAELMELTFGQDE